MGEDKVLANDVSRRSFLKGSAVAAAGAMTAAVLGGCSPQGAESQASGTAASSAQDTACLDDVWALDQMGEPTETLSADVVIVGGGGTGMAAAIQAQELGLNAIVLEKAGALGGSFSATEGTFGIETRWQKERGETTTTEDAVLKCLNYHHYIPNPKIYRKYFSMTADTIQWLEDHGCKFRDVVEYNHFLAWHVYYYDEEASSPGSYFVKSLAKATEESGAEVLLNTAAKQLVMKDGSVAGVLAEGEGGKIMKIEAPAVMLASGGYANNLNFLHAVSPYTVNENLQSLGAPGHDGDGMKMARAVGAQLAEGYGTVMWCGPCAVGATWATDAYSASVQPTLWVNHHAERYINEDLWIGNFAAGGVAARNQKKTYVIFTESDLAAWEQSGPYGAVFTFGTPGVPLSKAREQLESLSSVHKADSISALAQSVGLDEKALQKTVDEYNAACAEGIDKDFGKASEHLRPIAEGPYYILEVADGYYATVGGVRISPDAEVLDANDEPISGLYAGGCNAGGLYGDSYDVECAPGSQAGWAVNSGRIAMMHVATRAGA